MRDRAGDARGLIEFIDASPSPFHAAETAARMLREAGFEQLDETADWPRASGRRFVVRGGSLVAWVQDDEHRVTDGFRIIGAHTDSPNLRIKPNPDCGAVGFRQLGVEVYGGALLNSWLDRDLGISGRVSLRTEGRVEVRLVRVDRPLLRIPQLAIHLDRGVNDSGLRLNPQEHLRPVWGLGDGRQGTFAGFLAGELGVEPDHILAWELMTHDLTPSCLLGVDGSLLSAPRIDNLASCYAAVRALSEALLRSESGPVPVVCLFDHEEIGSQSSEGADSTLLPSVLERICLISGGDREAFHRALARSLCASVDGAHATHPNYADRHEPQHRIRINGGPVLKVNSNVRYATDAVSAAAFALACERADVPLQRFVTRTDLPCGSTIGPVTAARLGVPTVDVGMPQLAMHAARELCGSADPALLVRALTAFLRVPRP
ncbi:MAG: M18 family aminopeptidase [Acidimicrobiales bacterium]